MIAHILLGLVFIVSLAGCATTGHKAQQDQFQTRITELEKKVEEKDSEIVDLQYQVKDLSSKVSSKETSEMPIIPEETVTKSSSKAYGDDIIRVEASAKDIQTALRNAGVYTGKIDGKIGSGTKAAIVEFQKQNRLASDGVLGKKTWKVLKTYLNAQ